MGRNRTGPPCSVGRPRQGKCPSVCAYVRTSVRSQSFFDLNEIWHVGRGWRVMHGGMQYDSIQGQGHEPVKAGNPAVFKSYLFCHLQWELATDHEFLNKCTISKLDRAGYLIFVLFLCHVTLKLALLFSCEELTVIPHTGLILLLLLLFTFGITGIGPYIHPVTQPTEQRRPLHMYSCEIIFHNLIGVF